MIVKVNLLLKKDQVKISLNYKNKNRKLFMKTKMITKLSPLFVALSVASASTFAGELSSFKSEVKLNDYKGGYQKTEGTLALGSYKINDTYKFLFDVDKDYVAEDKSEEDSVAKEGWDTQFAIAQKITKFGDVDLSFFYFIRYDESWEADSGDASTYTAQYIFSPVFDTSFNIADNDYYFTVELWAQGGESDGGSLQDVSGAETNFYFGGPLSDNWSFDLAWYNFDYYDGDRYDYQIGTEDYLTYTQSLNDNLSFVLEAYYEAYYRPDSGLTSNYGHIKPILKYKKKLGEKFSVHASVGYDAVKYVKGEGSSSSWGNNELEITAGFSF